MNILSEENLNKAVNIINKIKSVKLDIDMKWIYAKKRCPNCGYKNKYYGGLALVEICSKCNKVFKPF